MKIKTTCIIDDDPIFIFGTKILLKNNNFSEFVLVSNNGKEAISDLQEYVKKTLKLPEIIFLDLNMPVMDGWEFLDSFDSFFKDLNTKIYILSSSIDSRDLERSKKYSIVKGFIAKPLTDKRINDLKNDFSI
ncbi:response regulator [uncultured Maribacter sp.]|uniref:response regulator n=1 Tax=uncultured Maribacter sp. TaxID=431308 RepID=UPI002618176E|nr:response regulator [uncultured Maribacter sp.]